MSTRFQEFVGFTQREPSLVTLPAETAVFHAIRCNDTAWTSDPKYWIEAGNRANEQYPYIGGSTTENPCIYWSKPTTTKPDTAANKLPPVLMVQSEFDAATPSEGALRALNAAQRGSRLYRKRDEPRPLSLRHSVRRREGDELSA